MNEEDMEKDPRFWAGVFNFGRFLIRSKDPSGILNWNRNYQDYIKSDVWKARAEKAKTKAGNRCQLCNSDKDLHAHHRTYDRLGREEGGDITVLCKSCHYKFHWAEVEG